MSAREQLRDFNTINDDILWPDGGLSADPLASVRHHAVYEVLTTAPVEVYDTLKGKIDDFCWYIPSRHVGGELYPFPATWKRDGYAPIARVLYLSPELERSAWDVVVATVAHELAHIALEHEVFWSSGEQYNAQEHEVFEFLCESGFGKEARKLRAVNRWRDSRDKRLLEEAKREREKANSAASSETTE